MEEQKKSRIEKSIDEKMLILSLDNGKTEIISIEGIINISAQGEALVVRYMGVSHDVAVWTHCTNEDEAKEIVKEFADMLTGAVDFSVQILTQAQKDLLRSMGPTKESIEKLNNAIKQAFKNLPKNQE